MAQPIDRSASDRAALSRRIGWERSSVRLARLVIGLFFVGRGVAFLAGVGDAGWFGLLMVGLGASVLWDVYRSDGRGPGAPNKLSSEQHTALEATIERDGRMAAVKQLRIWTGASYGEAANDIDAAFPESR